MSVGWVPGLIGGVLDPVEARTGYRFSHAVLTPRHRVALDRPVYTIREDVRSRIPPADTGLLASLERAGVPTIHNMIMGDRFVSRLPYAAALSYATFLATRLRDIFSVAKPSVIIGGFDGLHGGIGLAVASQLGIPWFAFHFSAIPHGLSCFCSGTTPDTSVAMRAPDGVALRALAERTLHDFETRQLSAGAYTSANSVGLILRRLPDHFAILADVLKRSLRGDVDEFTEWTPTELCVQYLRKRANLFRLPLEWFSKTPLEQPYLFFGLHMQPESSIDVWAPFHADQFNVVESIARSMPPTFQLLVKVHRSDADNYSRRQLARLHNLPGVRLVSPFVDSRGFIEGASLVLAIQGTMAIEAALLGKPVLMFGDSRFSKFPSVSTVRRVADLPGQILAKLAEPRPERESILRGCMSYLSAFSPGCYNDWSTMPSSAEIEALSDQFRALEAFVSRQPVSAC